jgi:hypothetical protein
MSVGIDGLIAGHSSSAAMQTVLSKRYSIRFEQLSHFSRLRHISGTRGGSGRGRGILFEIADTQSKSDGGKKENKRRVFRFEILFVCLFRVYVATEPFCARFVATRTPLRLSLTATKSSASSLQKVINIFDVVCSFSSFFFCANKV